MSSRDFRGHQPRYHLVAIVLHWTIALAIITAIALALFTDDMPRPIRAPYIGVHKALGITVLALTVIRLLWRLSHRPPPLPRSDPAWLNRIAHMLHWAFYGLMIALPLSGWIGSSAARKPISWFGLFPIPFLPVAEDKGLRTIAFDGHEIMGWAMIVLLVIHVAAALKHQFIDRDNLLARMKPSF